MAYTLSSTQLAPEIAGEIWGKVQSGSAVATLSPNQPKTTYGPQVQMVWTTRPKAQIRTQGQAKGDGSGTLSAVTADSFKVVVNQRISDEFVRADAERQATLLRGITDASAGALLEQLDIAAFYGLSVLDATRATVVSHYINEATDTSTFPGTLAATDYTKANGTVWGAASLVMANGYNPNGVALSNKLVGALGASADTSGRPLFPEIQLSGLGLTSFAGVPAAITENVHGGRVVTDTKRRAFVGDYSSLFWGFVNGIEMETIEYGDPDGIGRDLKAYNEVVVRLEAYLYMGLADIKAFASVALPAT